MAQYRVLQLDDDGEPDTVLGQLEVDGEGMLHIVGSEPAGTAALEKAVEDLNGRKALTVKLPPDPAEPEEDESYGVRKIKVARDDPGFFDAIQDNLRRWHGMVLAE